jgi:hypothetical protein
MSTDIITLPHYFTGPDGSRRDRTHALRMSPAIETEAVRTVALVSRLLQWAGLSLPLHANGTHVASGWRPPEVNAATPGAAPNSLHMTGRAIDIYDPDGDLDEWLITEAGQRTLAEIGLWMEHPAATKGWSHLQTVPPRSGRRVFYP